MDDLADSIPGRHVDGHDQVIHAILIDLFKDFCANHFFIDYF